jgi:rhodanese-related sulfurtransferase
MGRYMFGAIKKLLGDAVANARQVRIDNVLVLDVRTPFEFKTGHIRGSKNIPLDTLPYKVDELKKLNKTIITVCRSGTRSVAAKNMLVAAGLDACDGGLWTNFK